jgi:hypothetical protein
MAAGAVSAQLYPPVGYPPGGGYPNGYPQGGAGIPIGSHGQKPPDPKGPLPNYRGKMKKMDDKTIVLTTADDRDILFKRDSKTKYFKNGDEIKIPLFNPGDQLSIEGPAYGNGYMLAVNVYWERAAGTPDTSASAGKQDDSVHDAWKTDPKATGQTPPPPAPPKSADAPAAATGSSAGSATGSISGPPPPPARPDADDPGPPSLRRGAPSDVNREHAAPLPEIPPTGPANPPQLASGGGFRNEEDIPVSQRRGDDLIRRATDAAMDFTESLPNYVCRENVGRYVSQSHVPNWQAVDIVGTDVIYENHKESYKNLTINGKAVKKSMEEMDGAWSTGEFGTILINLFSPGTVSEFKFVKDSRSGGILAKMYEFNVTHANSTWQVHVGGQVYSPAYKGAVWIDPHSARVLRIEMQAYGFPQDFPTDHVESATDYEYTRLGDSQQYLLPVHSENLMCQRGSDDCSRNVIDFRNYRKYTGESTIKYGDPK